MKYLIGLFLLLGAVFYLSDGNNITGILNGNVLEVLKNRADDLLFPKTEKEVLIDNLSTKYDSLNKFFSGSVPRLLGSKDISREDKDIIEEAAQSFSESKELLDNLASLEKKDKSLTKTIIQKVLGLTKESEQALEPTHIPPQCRLECSTD